MPMMPEGMFDGMTTAGAISIPGTAGRDVSENVRPGLNAVVLCACGSHS